MTYWLVRAKWGMVNKKAEFISNDEWINGYDDKYLDVVNRVEINDILLLAEDSTITHYGICSENEKNGEYLLVDKWMLLKEPILFPARGAYIKTIVKVNDESLIEEVTLEIEKTRISNDIKIKQIVIENFTVFNSESLIFSDGLNVVVGENGGGKSHLLKLLYSVLIVIDHIADSYIKHQKIIFHDGGRLHGGNSLISEAINISLMEIFKPDELDNLISHNKDKCSININLGKTSILFDLMKHNKVYADEQKHPPTNFFEKSSVFIPAKEMLSFYEGFVALYENRETSFDKIYYNLARSLSLPALKNIESYPVENKLLSRFEDILGGKIVLERGRFYLVSNNGHKTEIALIAEGLRKIATIAQLIANGSLNKNSILFWDEPEANLNPRLIKKVAEVLVELSRAGMQIFIATHSLFLVKELEILRNKEDKINYFSFGFDGQDIRVSQSEDFEYLDDIVILDEELEQSDRFLSKKED